MSDNGHRATSQSTPFKGDDAFTPNDGCNTKPPSKSKLDDRHRQGLYVARKLREQRKDQANQRRPWDKQRFVGDFSKLLAATNKSDAF